MVRVTRLPKDPGPAGWARLLEPRDPTPPLETRATADWLVVGGGYAGLSAARRLSQNRPGNRIVLLEAGRIAEGPAGRNSGFMIDLPHDLASENYGGALERDRLQTEDNRRAIAFAAEMVDEFDLPDEAFQRTGKINGAASARGRAHNANFARHLGAMGETFEELDAQDMRAITGSDYYAGGLFTPGSVNIQPALYVREIARGLRSNRLIIHEESPVLALERQGDWVARTPRGQITAPNVILAVNGHLQSFGHMASRLMHVFTYASMTRALIGEEIQHLGGHSSWGITPADPLGSTVRRVSGVGGDRILIRNTFTYEPSLEVSDAKLARITAKHDARFQARFPVLAGVAMEYRWGGRLCLSRNTVQVIGELEPGLWSACCQNGLGIAKGTLAGMLAADGATGRDSPALQRALGADAPKRLPPVPVAKVGATARLMWGERQAGREL